MRRAVPSPPAALVVVAATVLACVPASEPLPPAGAAGAKTLPSPAAQRQPFVTSDGWTIVIEKTVLRARVACRSRTSYSSNEDTWLWYGDASLDVFTPALEPGTCAVHLTLDPGNFYRGKPSTEDLLSRVSEEDAAPFEVALFSLGDSFSAIGASVTLRAHAERAGRTVDVDIALAARGTSSYGLEETGAIVEVRADELVTAPVFVRPEAIFTRTRESSDPRGGLLTFDEIADADRNGDGRVTTDELRAAPRSCERCAPSYVNGLQDDSLHGELATRASAILDDDAP